MNFRMLLAISAILSTATFILLTVAPTSIPSAFGITLSPKQYLLSYLVGGGDLAIAYLSLAGRRIKDIKSLRAIAWFIIIFHAQFGLFCIYVLVQGTGLNLMGNILFRLIAVVLFYYFGVYKTRSSIATIL